MTHHTVQVVQRCLRQFADMSYARHRQSQKKKSTNFTNVLLLPKIQLALSAKAHLWVVSIAQNT